MKRLAVIFISVLVLLITVQPAVAFHFCSGKLVSIEVPSHSDSTGCCSAAHNNDNSENSIVKDTCCHTSVTAVSTGDYLHQYAKQQTIPLSPYTLLYVRHIADSILTQTTVSASHKAPPGYIPSEGKEILMRFCVYII